MADAGRAWFATNSGVLPSICNRSRSTVCSPLLIMPTTYLTIIESMQFTKTHKVSFGYRHPIPGCIELIAHGPGHPLSHDPADSNSIGANNIWGIAPGRNGKLWLAAWEAGISQFDPKTGHSIQYRHDPDNPASLSSDRVTTILEDRSGVVWAGTWDAGLDRFDPATGKFSHFTHDPADPTSLSDNNITTLLQDRNGEPGSAPSPAV